MWKPAERIKYQTEVETWPNVERAASSRLFSPIGIGGMTLEQRTWIPAMVPWRSNEEGEVTQDVIDWYSRFAEGKPGAIVIEATGIRDIPSGPLLRISNDSYVPGLKRLVDAVREASGGHTRLLIQLIDFLGIRRRPDPQKYFDRFLVVTDQHRSLLGMESEDELTIRAKLSQLSDDELESVLSPTELEALRFGYRERVTDMHIPAIAQLPQTLPGLFAQAGVRAKQAGFDGIELHYAHAYTMSSFLSATNTRTDGYGGSAEERLRLPLEVFARVRDSVGSDLPVGCRFLSDEIIEGGSGLDDARFFATEFARAGMDFLSLSRGGKFDDAKQPKVGWAAYPYTGRSGYECMPSYISDAQGPWERNVEPVAAIRTSIRQAGCSTPIITAGGIYSFEQAERLLAEEKADVVGFARQALADPDWFEKVRQGRGDEVMLCRYSNYCEGLDQKHKQVTCELWDREELEQPDTVLATDGKRRLTAPRWRPDLR
ncbi:MAG: NADH:flavin oxidoreductase [Luminiphilus sp.]|jgi:2,4-dienoyl-CoA reductase-like NADH-dependent reductase (Old Yellow Enzyme family)